MTGEAVRANVFLIRNKLRKNKSHRIRNLFIFHLVKRPPLGRYGAKKSGLLDRVVECSRERGWSSLTGFYRNLIVSSFHSLGFSPRLLGFPFGEQVHASSLLHQCHWNSYSGQRRQELAISFPFTGQLPLIRKGRFRPQFNYHLELGVRLIHFLFKGQPKWRTKDSLVLIRPEIMEKTEGLIWKLQMAFFSLCLLSVQKAKFPNKAEMKIKRPSFFNSVVYPLFSLWWIRFSFLSASYHSFCEPALAPLSRGLFIAVVHLLNKKAASN